MTVKKTSPPDPLKPIADDWVDVDGSCPPGEHRGEPVGKDRDRQRLRARVLEGAASPPAGMADPDHFARLRSRVREAGR